MGRFSRKKKDGVAERGLYRVPSESEMHDKLREMEEVNQRIAGDPRMQEAMRGMLGQEPAETPQARMEKMLGSVKTGGLSYIGPPADFPEVAPDAHKLWLGEAFLGSMLGDDAMSLAKFNEALEITRRKGHKAAEARLLYNIGIAHYKLGDLDKAIEVLLEGKALTQGVASELGREARKVQRFEEEVKTEDPRVDVLGVPHFEQQLLEMYLEALATVYEADSQAGKAAECRDEIKGLYRQGA